MQNRHRKVRLFVPAGAYHFEGDHLFGLHPIAAASGFVFGSSLDTQKGGEGLAVTCALACNETFEGGVYTEAISGAGLYPHTDVSQETEKTAGLVCMWGIVIGFSAAEVQQGIVFRM